ncbi:hypothetical protein D3C80_1398000 [compost metagenome]
MAGKFVERPGDQVIPLGRGQQHLETARLAGGAAQVLDQHHLDAPGQQPMSGGAGLAQVGQVSVAQGLQLQQVRRHDVGHRQRLFGQEAGHAGGDDAALLRVTHHGIAEIDGLGVGRLDGRDHRQDLVPLLGRTQIAAQHRIALPQHLDLHQPLAEGADVTGRHRHPLPSRLVLGMVGELHSVDGPHFHAETAHGEHGGAVTGTTKNHVGLDRENAFHGNHHRRSMRKAGNISDEERALPAIRGTCRHLSRKTAAP